MNNNLPSNDSFNSAMVGFWSSLAFTVLLIALNISFVIKAVKVPPAEWEGIDSYSRSYRIIAFVPQGIGLASVPALILMLASIHIYARGFRKILSLAGLAFGIAFAVLVGSLYFVQVGILLPALKHGNWHGLDQYAFANPSSIAWGLNHFAWSLLGFAFLFVAGVFEGHGLECWIRWFFVLNGLANISLIFAFAFGIEMLTLVVAFLSWVVTLPVAGLLVALMFRTNARSIADTNGNLRTM
jgi:hypothetical protein